MASNFSLIKQLLPFSEFLPEFLIGLVLLFLWVYSARPHNGIVIRVILIVTLLGVAAFYFLFGQDFFPHTPVLAVNN